MDQVSSAQLTLYSPYKHFFPFVSCVMFPSIFVFISDSLDAINCMMLVIRSNASDLSAATLSRLAGIFLSLARQLLMMFHQVRVDGLPFSLLYPSLSHAPSYKRITSAL